MSLWLRRRDLRTLLYIAIVIKFLATFEYTFIIFLLIFLLDSIVVMINLIQLLAAILIRINYLSLSLKDKFCHRVWRYVYMLLFSLMALLGSCDRWAAPYSDWFGMTINVWMKSVTSEFRPGQYTVSSALRRHACTPVWDSYILSFSHILSPWIWWRHVRRVYHEC